MATAAEATAPPGQALARVRPQERALVQAASEIGIPIWEAGGVLGLDFRGAELRKRFNVLAPAAMLMQANPNFTPGIAVVDIDPNPDAGDVYPQEKDQNGKPKTLSLTKVGLRKLGDKAGIGHLPSTIEYHGKDVTVTAAIRKRKPDGSFIPFYGSQNWIADDEREAVENECPNQWGRGESAHVLTAQERADWIKKRWAQVRKSNLRMTESKALNAAYREGLPGLKQKYTPQELQKPFLVIETNFTPDPNDPEMTRMVFTGGERATDLLYGPAALPAHTDAIEGVAFEHDEAPANVDPETGEIFEGAAAEVEPQGHGPRPTEDPILPSGPHEGKPVSEAARLDPGYVKKYLVGSSSAKWGTAADEWLTYWHGEGSDDDIPFA